ncbi:MAG: helix-turn-helix domain-containing protein [Eubacteriales bacterium]|nr:helix-turn-helix domain-containing protein [Eubacteriales bacterium]
MDKANRLIHMSDFTRNNTKLIPSELRVRTSQGAAELTVNEMCILLELARQDGRVLTREHLLTQLHMDTSEKGKRSIDVYISTLRKKLSHIDSNLIIQTVRGLGYVIE